MQEISKKFRKETEVLDDKLYAMKQSAALKAAHLEELKDEEKEQHSEEAKKTAALHKAAKAVKDEASVGCVARAMRASCSR